MAIFGGAGNVAGSNPSGTGASLNYIGIEERYAFAYSGLITGVGVKDTENTMFDFTIGSDFIVGTWRAFYDEDSGDDMRFRLYLNDEVIQSTTSSRNYETGRETNVNFIIPPYGHVKLTFANITDTSANTMAASISGRVYS